MGVRAGSPARWVLWLVVLAASGAFAQEANRPLVELSELWLQLDGVRMRLEEEALVEEDSAKDETA